MIKTIGVIGAGQMGSGIAHVAAFAGYDVRLSDISEDALKRAVANIGKNLDRAALTKAFEPTPRSKA